MSAGNRRQVPVAVVGVSALFPGSSDSRGFWSDILAGKDLVTDVPETHWLIDDYYDPNPAAPDKTYAKRGAFLSPVDFDPMEFGIPPTNVPSTDSAQLLALIVAQRVLEDAAQGQFAKMDRERISVLLGVTSAQNLLGAMVSRLQKPIWLKALRESGIPEGEAQAICERIAANYVPWKESSFPGLLGNVVAGRIANRFDLRGTNAVTDAACASSLAAVSMGINELQSGQSDLVITGGVDAMNDIFMYVCFSKTPALSPTGDCRPFSDAADGTLLGEGLAMLALKRLSDAERDGDRVYAVIKGVGSASDGRAKSVYAPVPEGQARALRRAYQVAGYGADTVELVEAHGTGTKAGDAAEFDGLRQAFGEAAKDAGRTDRQWCALGSVKSQIGHTKAAAGAAGLFKAVMALHHKVLPPTIKVDRPNPKLDLESSPFYLNTQTRPWIRSAAHPRRAGVSSFGFGGSNFHVALEEYVPGGGAAKPAYRLRSSQSELLLLSAGSAPALAARCRALAQTGGDLTQAARESHAAFQPSSAVRLAVVASSASDLAEKLNAAAASIDQAPATGFSTPGGVHYAAGAASPGEVAFLFPGQGSQYVGMGADVAMAFDAARAVWDAAAGTSFDHQTLQSVVFPRPVFTDAAREQQARQLTSTEWAQPALGAHSLALEAVLHSVGLRPACVAGHSFGEVTALQAAGVFGPGALLGVARRRGELMKDAAQIPGAMTAVTRPIAEVRALVAASGAAVVVANHNAPEQVVLSGSLAAIEQVEAALAAKGVTAKRLPVATAFHSPLVAGSSAPFLQHLAGLELSLPAFEVFGNADAAPYPKEPQAIRERLSAQLAQPVRFVELIEAMYARGVRTFVEVGAGSVLTDLVGRILEGREHRAIHLDRKGKNGVTTLLDGLGRLSVAGVPLDLGALWARFAPSSSMPVKKPAMVLPVSGHNPGPYPPKGGAKALPPPNPPRAVVVEAAPRAVAMPHTAPVHTGPVHAAPAHAAPAQPAPAAVAPVYTAPVPVAPAAPIHAPAAAPALQGAWVSAYQEAQRQTADAHAAYQRAMADSHLAFLRTAESGFAGLTALLTGQHAPAPQHHARQSAPQLPAAVYTPEPLQLAPAPAMVHTPAPVHAPAPPAAPHDATEKAPAAPEVRAPAQVHAPAPAPLAAAPAPAAAPSGDLDALLLSIVAEKTGYPVEMLGAGMSLEADLGIDSIKRVEILSAVRERAPGLREVKPSELAALQTLGQIADHLRAAGGGNGAAVSASVSAPASASASASAPAAASASADLDALLLSIVAEKTGYPVEMLGAQMSLEADLGIDSIKRVEILSAVRERAPGLREVKPSELAALQTLGQIADHLRAAGGVSAANGSAANHAPAAQARVVNGATPNAAPANGAATNGAAAVHAAPAAASPAPAADAAAGLDALLLAIVAEKTGYPVEMLGAQMSLEADLGIDSIKRVEILSAVRERAPGLREVKPAELAALQTLGQIAEHLRGAAGGAAPAAANDASPAVETSTEGAPVERFAVREIEARPVGMALAHLLDASSVAVTDDGAGVARALVRKLSERGVRAAVVARVPADAGAVIFLGGLRAAASEDAAVAVNREAFHAAKAVAARFNQGPGAFVTVQDTGGDFGLSGRAGARAWLGGVSALARTAVHEWPQVAVKAIDLERGGRDAEAQAALISGELLGGGNTLEVGLRADGRRTSLASVAAAVATNAAATVGASSVVLVSGGARGVTAAALIALAKAHRPRFALLGRTPLEQEPADLAGLADEAGLKRAVMKGMQARGEKPQPAAVSAQVARVLACREVQATLAALAAAGAQARYLACDVQDAAALGAALDGVRREWGPITGLVHGAGVLADKRISEKTDEQFDRVFDTKVAGLRALLAATGADPLAFVCLFSSVAARSGNLGQCDYAMANEVLNLVACAEQARRGPGCVVRSIGWGPWEGGMVTPSLKARFQELGVALIPLEGGARAFVSEVSGAAGEVTVVIGGNSGAPRPAGSALEGSGPLGAAVAPSALVEVRVSARSHPFLGDHRIAGAVVVPVAMALEWMLRGARACRPDLALTAVRNLKVLRGIKLEAFDGDGELLSVHARQLSNGAHTQLAVELRGRNAALHYSATIEMGERLPAAPAARPAPALAPWGQAPIYDGHLLFHGPRFQVLRAVDGVSAAGLTGSLVGARALHWPEDQWRSDPALVDGGLQALLLWVRRALGGASLPMAIGEYRCYREGLIDGPVRCVLLRRELHESRAVCDLALLDAQGAVVAELLAVEAVLRPGETRSAAPGAPALA